MKKLSDCLILGLGGFELLTAELGSLAGRGERELATRKGEAGPQSTRKSQGESLIPRALQFTSLSQLHAAGLLSPGQLPIDPMFNHQRHILLSHVIMETVFYYRHHEFR